MFSLASGMSSAFSSLASASSSDPSSSASSSISASDFINQIHLLFVTNNCDDCQSLNNASPLKVGFRLSKRGGILGFRV